MEAYSMGVSPTLRKTGKIQEIYQEFNNALLSTSHAELAKFHLSQKVLLVEGEEKMVRHVGIVGAGLAGLRCAVLLLLYGFQVTILEARDRIGGRVHQAQVGDHMVDLGPNWLYMCNRNPLLALAVETGTALTSYPEHVRIFDQDGKLLSAREGKRVGKATWDIIVKALKYSSDDRNKIKPEETLKEYITARVEESVPRTVEGYERMRRLMLDLAEAWGAFIGSELEQQSLKYAYMEESYDGESLLCLNTYKNILETVAKPVTEAKIIKYNTRVKEIYGSSLSDTAAVGVRTADDKLFEFHELVVTAPLGWLKQNVDAFYPPLPNQLSKAIGSLGYGSLEKVYITFPKPFWLKPDAKGRRVQGFTEWLAPNYSPDLNPKKWHLEMLELGSAPVHPQPTLLFYTYGEESKHVTTTARSIADKVKRDAYLIAFFRPYFSRLPSYQQNDAECQPLAVLATDWQHDELSGNGSYTNFQVGLQNAEAHLGAMRAGVHSEGIWLAGEHTAPLLAVATATGAYMSGERAACGIAERYYGRGFVQEVKKQSDT